MTRPAVEIRHVVQAHKVVDAIVTAPDGTRHRIGHLPREGWYCCEHGKRCRSIPQVQALVPSIGPPPTEGAATT